MSDTITDSAKVLRYDAGIIDHGLEAIVWTEIEGADYNSHVRINDHEEKDQPTLDLLCSFAFFQMFWERFNDSTESDSQASVFWPIGDVDPVWAKGDAGALVEIQSDRSRNLIDAAAHLRYDVFFNDEGDISLDASTEIEGNQYTALVTISGWPKETPEAVDLLCAFSLFIMMQEWYVEQSEQQNHPERLSVFEHDLQSFSE